MPNQSLNRSRPFWVIVVVSVAAMFWLQVHYAPPTCREDCVKAFNIVDFEFAGSADRACRILNSWAAPADDACTPSSAIVAHIRLGLLWDFGFALSYGLFGWLLGHWLLRRFGPIRAGQSLPLMVPLAGLFDGIENTTSAASNVPVRLG